MAGFIGAGALAGNATVATQAISSHASTAIGDILICQLINKTVTANVTSPPDGTWTKLVEATNNAASAGWRHQYTIYWKRATVAGAQSYTFTKATDDNILFAGVISTWRNVGIDATTPAVTATTAAAESVSFPAFDPTSTSAHVIYFAFYGLSATTFAGMAGTNPTCTNRYDLESATGTTCTLACTSGDSTGASIASRTWISASTTDAGNTGVVLALTSLETVPVVEGDVLVTGQTVTVEETEVTPVTPATVSIAGQTVTIAADSSPAGPGSDDVRFASSRTRLNFRRGLLYRSLTTTIRPLAVTDTVSVTQASVVFTGKTVTPVDITSDTVLVGNALVTITGKPVLVFDLESITRATVSLAGQTVSIGDSALPGNDDVQFASSRTRLNVRRGLLYRSLTTAPRVGGVIDTVTVTQASVVFTGKTVTVRDTEVTPVTQASVVYTGKTVTILETERTPVLKASVLLTGKPVTETELIPVLKATVTFTGKTVNSIDGDFVPVLKASVLYTGKTVTPTDSMPVLKASVVFTGKTVNSIDGDRTPVTQAAVLFTGKPVLETETVPVNKATVVLTGKTVAGLDITPVLKATVTVTGQTVTVRDSEVTPILKATVAFTGKSVLETETIPVNKATIVFGGQTVTTIDPGVDRIVVDAAAVLFTGKGVFEREVPVTKGSVLFTGQTVTVRDFEVTPVLKASVVFTGKTVTVRDSEVTPVAKATVLFTGKTVTPRETEVTPVLKALVQFSGQTVTLSEFSGETVQISKADVLFTGQTVTVTDTGIEVPGLPGGGGGVSVPPWLDYGRKKRRRYRALEEIEARLDKKIEKLTAESKETQQEVAAVLFQVTTVTLVPDLFGDLLRRQAQITQMLLEAQRRAEKVRQEKIELARLAQIAAFEADEEEAITMLLLT